MLWWAVLRVGKLSDLMDRCGRALVFLNDASLPILDQLDKAGECLDGVILSDLESQVRERFMKPLESLPMVTQKYDLQPEDTLARLSPEDLAQYRHLLLKAFQDGLAAEQERLIKALDADWPVVPKAAILEIRAHRELMIPALIECIRSAAHAVQQQETVGYAPFYALVLLCEFQATEALPTIIEAVSLPGKLPEDIFNDEGIGEFLRRALALCSPDVVVQLIANTQIYKHVRWAAMEALAVMVGAERLGNDQAVELISDTLRSAIDNSAGEIATFAVFTLSRLAPKAVLPMVKEAHNKHLIDGFLVDYDAVVQAAEKPLAQVIETLQRHMPLVMSDAIEELEMLGFRCEPDKPTEPTKATNRSAPKPHMLDLPRATQMPLQTSTVRNTAKPGRNDPCNCGSGKKYKKCCGH